MIASARNAAHPKNLSTSVIPLLYNVAQNKATSDDSVEDCVWKYFRSRI
jgi:hypothetical protein